METLEEKIARVLKDEVDIVSYDAIWPELFLREKHYLLDCLPGYLIQKAR